MSAGERCSSLDRGMRHKPSKPPRYIPGKSPNRSPTRNQSCSPQHVPSSPEPFRYMPSPGTLVHTPSYALGRYNAHTEDILTRPEEHFYDYNDQIDNQLAKTPLREPSHGIRGRRRIENLPEELLEEFEEPSFYEPPENASFDELMCVFPSPVVTGARTPMTMEPSSPKTKSPVTKKVQATIEEVPKSVSKKKVVSSKGQPKQRPVQHPPDYIDPEDAAAILLARQLAGLKTSNPKLLPKRSTPPGVKTLPEKMASPSPLPTYEGIIRRMEAIRAAANAKKAETPTRTPALLSTSVQDQLDEFETLEQLYEAQPLQCPRDAAEPGSEIGHSLVERIEHLQRQLLDSPKPPASPAFELPPIIRYYDLLRQQDALAKAQRLQHPEEEHGVETDSLEVDVDLNEIQNIADWELAELSQNLGPIPESPLREKTPKRQDICIPMSLATPKVPEYLLSPNLLADFDLEEDHDMSLVNISMPAEVCLQDSFVDEPRLDDVTSPDLDDLSISVPEALQPDYPLDLSSQEQDKSSAGFLTSVVGAVVDKFRNMFVGSASEGVEDEQKATEVDRTINLDSSLPNIFKSTPPPAKPITSQKLETVASCPPKAKETSPESPIVIPTDPIHPKDYKAMVKRAQLIHKLRAREAAKAKAQVEVKSEKKPEIKSTIPKRAPAPKKRPVKKKSQTESPQKIYPPGEYPPGYVEAVARARLLAGYKNRSALLNPQRAARLAALRAQKEAEQAAEAALPPVERMKKRIARIREKRGKLSTLRPSIDTLATLEAIRESLPKPEIPKPPGQGKWKPMPRKLKTGDEVFSKQYQRAVEQIQPMTPIKEESFAQGDLISFSPLRPHEMRLRLEHLKKQAESKAISKSPIKSIEEYEEVQPFQYTPITLDSPERPRTKETLRETVTTRIDDQSGLEERIHEEILETSIIDKGEVHTTTKKITTKTDAFGNIKSRQEEDVENIDAIGVPVFLDISDTMQAPPDRDSVLPGPSELIEKIRQQAQQRLQMAQPTPFPRPMESPLKIPMPTDLPDEDIFEIDMPQMDFISPIKQMPISAPPATDPTIRTPSELIEKIRQQVQKKLEMTLPIHVPRPMESPMKIPMPTDLPDEDIFDIDMPQMDLVSPIKQMPTSPHLQQPADVSLPYLFPDSPQRIKSPHVSPEKPQKPICPVKVLTPVVEPKKETIIIPPYPKDPKDYVGMVKLSRALYQLQKQKEAEGAALAAKQPPAAAPTKKPLSKKPKVSKEKLPPKKKPPKEIPPDEYPAEPPPLPADYVAAVARARQLAGLKNTTALLNPALAAKIAEQKAADEAELAEFEKLSAFGQIQKRMEKLRNIPEKRKLQPSAEVLGMIEAIRANLPEIEAIESETQEEMRERPVCPMLSPEATEALARKPMESTDKQYTSLKQFEDLERQLLASEEGKTVVGVTDTSLEEFEALERQMAAYPKDTSLDEFEALERQMAACPIDTSLDEFEALERQLATCPKDTSLEEFEALEKQMAACPKDASLDEFEALERQLDADDYKKQVANAYAKTRETPKGIAGYRRVKKRNLMDEMTEPRHDPEFYQQLIGEFVQQHPKEPQPRRIKPFEDLIISTPLSAKERFRRIKEAQAKQILSSEIKTPKGSPTPIALTHYSPITLSSPSGPPSGDRSSVTLAMKTIERNVPLVNLQSPDQPLHFGKQFAQLEDMPLDDIEYEDLPTFRDVSFDKPLTPPPKPAELIARIRQQVQQRLREEQMEETIVPPPPHTKFPDNLPEEELLELSAPSFAQTPKTGTPKRPTTPRHSLPYVFGEPPAATPVEARKTPITIPEPESLPSQVTETKPATPKTTIGQIFPHNYPKEYVAMVKKAQEMYKLQQKQKEAEKAAPKIRPLLSKAPLKTRKTELRKKLGQKKKTTGQKADKKEDKSMEYPEELPPLPADYLAAVAHARKLAGLKNTTAALNPEIAAKIAAEKAKVEAEAAAFEAMTEHEKLKFRMEKLKQKPGFKVTTKPTMDQLAFLQHMKEVCPRAAEESQREAIVGEEPIQGVMLTPKLVQDGRDETFDEMAEFEKLEQIECPVRPMPAAKLKDTPALEIQDLITKMEQQQLGTPLPPQERFKQLLAQKQATPIAPQTPQLNELPIKPYSPILLRHSPTTPKRVTLSEKATTQITKKGPDTIKEMMRETSEIVNGELQETSEHITTATDSLGNIISQTKETKKFIGFDTPIEAEPLEAVDEPSFLDITPVSPIEAPPKPRDLIERIRKKVQSRPPRPEVPMGQLIELRTPPKALPLPQNVPDEDLLQITLPDLPKTPPTKMTDDLRKARKSPERVLNVSLPEMFVETPKQCRGLTSPQTEDYTLEAPPLPDDYVEQVAKARQLAGLKNTTAALNVKTATKSADELHFAKLMTKVAEMRKQGQLRQTEDSIVQSEEASLVCPKAKEIYEETPKTRLKKLKEWAAKTSKEATEDRIEPKTPKIDEIPYEPITLESPWVKAGEAWKLDASRFKELRDLSALIDLEEPSFLNKSHEQYSPQPTPSRLIAEIRQQVYDRLREENIQQTIVDVSQPDLRDASMPRELFSYDSPQHHIHRMAKSEVDIGDISMPADLSIVGGKTPDFSEAAIGDISMPSGLYSSSCAQQDAHVVDKSELDIGDISMPADMRRDLRMYSQLQNFRIHNISEPALGDISMPPELYSISSPQRDAYLPDRSELDIGDISMPVEMSRDERMLSQIPHPQDISEAAIENISMPSELYSFSPSQQHAYLADKSEVDIGDISMPADMTRDDRMVSHLQQSRLQDITEAAIGDISMPPELYSFSSPPRCEYVPDKSRLDVGDRRMVTHLQRSRLLNVSEPALGDTSMPPELYSFSSPQRNAYLSNKSEVVDIGDISMPADMSRDGRSHLHDISEPALKDISMPPELYSFSSPQRNAYLPNKSEVDIGDISMPADMSRDGRSHLHDISEPALKDISMPPELYSFSSPQRNAYLPNKSEVDIGDISMPADMSRDGRSHLHDISEPALKDISMPPELYSFSSPQRNAYLPNKSEVDIGDISMPADMSRDGRILSHLQQSHSQDISEANIGDISMPPELYSFSSPSRCAYFPDKSDLDIGDISMPADMTRDGRILSHLQRSRLHDISEPALKDVSMPPELYSFSSPQRNALLPNKSVMDIGDISMPADMSRDEKMVSHLQQTRLQDISEAAIGDISMPPELYRPSSPERCAYLPDKSVVDIDDISMPTNMSRDITMLSHLQSSGWLDSPQLISPPTRQKFAQEIPVSIKRTPLRSVDKRMQISFTPRAVTAIPEDSLAEFEALEKCERETPTTGSTPHYLPKTRIKAQAIPRSSKGNEQVPTVERMQISLTPRTNLSAMPDNSLAEFEALEKCERETPMMREGKQQKKTPLSSSRKLSITPTIPKLIPRSPVSHRQTPLGIKKVRRGHRLQMSSTPHSIKEDSLGELETLEKYAESTPVSRMHRSPYRKIPKSSEDKRMQMSITPRTVDRMPEESMESQELAEFEALERQGRQTPLAPRMTCPIPDESPTLAEFEALEKYSQGTPLARMTLSQNLKKIKAREAESHADKERMQMSITPRTVQRIRDESMESQELAEFEALERQGRQTPLAPRMTCPIPDESPTLAEFEALEKYSQGTPLARMTLSQNLKKIKAREAESHADKERMQMSITPRTVQRIRDESMESQELAEFEALEKQGGQTPLTRSDYKRFNTSITPRVTCPIPDESPTLAEFEALEKYSQGTPLARMTLSQNLKKIKAREAESHADKERMQMSITPRTVHRIPEESMESQELAEFEALEKQDRLTPLILSVKTDRRTYMTPRMACSMAADPFNNTELREFEEFEKNAMTTPASSNHDNIKSKANLIRHLAKQKMQVSITPRTHCALSAASKEEDAEFEALERYAYAGTPATQSDGKGNQRMHMSITPRMADINIRESSMEAADMAEFEALEKGAMETPTIGTTKSPREHQNVVNYSAVQSLEREPMKREQCRR
uniref:Uncharacterized protein n=1 Tax=Musca domestica TaxID=7370 RepID=A0A1I8NIE7_MUSDO